jgi:hypothetical protein
MGDVADDGDIGPNDLIELGSMSMCADSRFGGIYPARR